MFVTIKCNTDGQEETFDGDYSFVRADVTNFLIDHNHDISGSN